MALIIEGGLELPLPRMIPVRQKFPGRKDHRHSGRNRRALPS